ncbi:MAG: hypothetical protein V3W01_04100 [Dehalococcoidales bacterium]
MKRHSNFVTLAAIFVAVSTLVYFIHYLIFRNPHHIFIFMVGDLAFVFLEVFLVILVIERVLARRAKRAMLHKLNMITGAFFSEVGNQLLRKLLGCFERRKEISQQLALAQDWSRTDFKKATAFARGLKGTPQCGNIDLDELRTFLVRKRPFLLRLLENPNVLEHEGFSDLLWAVFHLAEELEARESLGNLPQSDLEHIGVDIQRVYGHLAAEWVAYMEHLKSDYPFLFSLTVRTHPFREHPSPVVL